MNRIEFGSGDNPTPQFIHVDRDPKAKEVDFVIDVLCLISPDIDKEDFPDHDKLLHLVDMTVEIRAVHFIEHIPWIYQSRLFALFYDLLETGGFLYIETPDLEWICRSYVKNYRNRKYPAGEHPALVGHPDDFHWWVNYKLFSGCSPGDYHHALYDRRSLKKTLEAVGFTVSVKSNHGTLCCRAVKPERESSGYYK